MRDIGGAIREHLTLRFAHGEEAKRYNVIQKLTYMIVLLVLLPIQVLAGLTMSPRNELGCGRSCSTCSEGGNQPGRCISRSPRCSSCSSWSTSSW